MALYEDGEPITFNVPFLALGASWLLSCALGGTLRSLRPGLRPRLATKFFRNPFWIRVLIPLLRIVQSSVLCPLQRWYRQYWSWWEPLGYQFLQGVGATPNHFFLFRSRWLKSLDLVGWKFYRPSYWVVSQGGDAYYPGGHPFGDVAPTSFLGFSCWIAYGPFYPIWLYPG